jgi:hypothetical protein
MLLNAFPYMPFYHCGMENPTTIIEQLDTAQLRARLVELDQERSAVVLLLRAAVARDRKAAAATKPRKAVTRGR